MASPLDGLIFDAVYGSRIPSLLLCTLGNACIYLMLGKSTIIKDLTDFYMLKVSKSIGYGSSTILKLTMSSKPNPY